MQWVAGVILLLPAPAAGQDRAEDLIGAAITAAGGPDVLAKFPAGRVSAKGAIFDGGTELPVVVEQEFHMPGRVRTATRSEPRGQKLELVQVVNGAKTRQAVNGTVIPPTEAAVRELHTVALVLEVGQLTPLLNDRKFTLKVERPGKAADLGVLVQVRDFPDLRLGFDRKSHHLVRVSRKFVNPVAAKEAELDIVLSDFQAFAGLTRPTRSVAFIDGRKVLDLTTTAFTPLEKADPNAFDIPD